MSCGPAAARVRHRRQRRRLPAGRSMAQRRFWSPRRWAAACRAATARSTTQPPSCGCTRWAAGGAGQGGTGKQGAAACVGPLQHPTLPPAHMRRSSGAERDLNLLPTRIVLVRHAQSKGNVDPFQ